MRFIRVLALLIAFGFFFGPVLGFLTGMRPVALENRPLAAAPDLSQGWAALDGLPTWASDHLVGRDRAIRANAWIDYRLFEEFPNAPSTTDLGPAVAGQQVASVPAAAPVVGRDGYLFLNADFYIACRDAAHFRAGLAGLRRVADLLEKAGKKVVLLVAPDKSSVATDKLRDVVPTGGCAQRAQAKESRLMAGFADPRSIDVYSALTEAQQAGGQPYWKTDSHWNSYGASLAARLLAEKLDPAVAASLQFHQGTVRRVGDLMTLGGLTYSEKAPSATVLGRTVVEGKGTHFSEQGPSFGLNSWRTITSAPTIPGRTLIIGDSYSYNALGVFRPLFAHGRFAWLGYITHAGLTDEIRRADTIVVEVVQRSVASAGLASPTYVDDVIRATRTTD